MLCKSNKILTLPLVSVDTIVSTTPLQGGLSALNSGSVPQIDGGFSINSSPLNDLFIGGGTRAKSLASMYRIRSLLLPQLALTRHSEYGILKASSANWFMISELMINPWRFRSTLLGIKFLFRLRIA